jgi:hypothetical protein
MRRLICEQSSKNRERDDMTCEMMESLGVFLVGAVDIDEWYRIDGHLAECAECRAEIVRLAGLPGLIGRGPTAQTIVSDRLWPYSPRTGPARHIRRRASWMTAGLAAAVLVIVALSLGIAVQRGGPSEPWSHRFALAGADPLTRVNGGASLTAESWGSEIWVQLNGVPDGTRCQLVVNTRTGHSSTSGAWTSDGHNGAWVPASAPFAPSEIVSIDVTTPTGQLVSLARQSRISQVTE